MASFTIVAAMSPRRYTDNPNVWLTAWFEELDGPVEFLASPYDCERHGKELWIRAMAGEYGPVTLIDPSPPLIDVTPSRIIDHDS